MAASSNAEVEPASWLGDFETQEVLGQGAFGKVYLGRNTKNSQQVAIKVINLEAADEDFDDIQVEIAILANMKHPNIVSYFGSFVNQKELWIIMEYLNGGMFKPLITTLSRSSFSHLFTLFSCSFSLCRPFLSLNLLFFFFFFFFFFF